MIGKVRGFTLVELMAVVAIIGILAALAMPIYQNYVKRTKMAEVVLAASACRTPVSEVYQARSDSGPGAGNWGCEVSSPASKYVQDITTGPNGEIIATAQNFGDATIDGKILTLVPLIGGTPANAATDMGKAITGWRCGDRVTAGAITTIPANYLPGSCQGS